VVVVVADIAFVGEVLVDSIVLVVVLVGIRLVVGRLVEEGLEDNPVVRRSILGST
jgi:hypothetical protein